MSVQVVITGRGFTPETYELVNKKAGVSAKNKPAGLESHSYAFDKKTGEFCIVDVWNTTEQFQAFFSSKITTTLTQMKVPMPTVKVMTVIKTLGVK